jgi:hypothetical protein
MVDANTFIRNTARVVFVALVAALLSMPLWAFAPKAEAHPGSHAKHTVKVCLAPTEDSSIAKCPGSLRRNPSAFDYRNGAWFATPGQWHIIKRMNWR